jgi:hypothetical protein
MYVIQRVSRRRRTVVDVESDDPVKERDAVLLSDRHADALGGAE